MKIYLVGVSDCESNSIITACKTKELAERQMFLQRDLLVESWKAAIDRKENDPVMKSSIKALYEPMIHALSHDDYENWDNYPHDVPYIREMEVLE